MSKLYTNLVNGMLACTTMAIALHAFYQEWIFTGLLGCGVAVFILYLWMNEAA